MRIVYTVMLVAATSGIFACGGAATPSGGKPTASGPTSEQRQHIEAFLTAAERPPLNLVQWTRGEIGRLGVKQIRVIQVVGGTEVIADVNGVDVWLEGFSTANIVDGALLSVSDSDVFMVRRPAEYKNTFGASRKILKLIMLDRLSFDQSHLATIEGELAGNQSPSTFPSPTATMEDRATRITPENDPDREPETADPPLDFGRLFTSRTGSTMRAKFIEFRFQGSRVILEKEDGSELDISMNDLSKPDQDWVREETKRRAKERK